MGANPDTIAKFLSIQAQDFIEDAPFVSPSHCLARFLSIQAQDFIEDPIIAAYNLMFDNS